MAKLICLINNYNYSRYLADSLGSAFNQTRPFDQVVVVDDGSTDDSREIIAKYAKIYKNLVPVFKENAGQLSTFNSALEYLDVNSQIFLLDSDDVYPADYLEQYDKKLQLPYPDFVYCKTQCFDKDASKITTALCGQEDNQVFPKTSALTRSRYIWVGNPTSCISMSGALYKKIFPYPYPEDFRTRADDVIIYGASLLGARKVFLPSLQIGYRTHQSNHFWGKQISVSQARRHDQAIEKMFSHFCSTFLMDKNPSIREFFSELKLLNENQRRTLKIPNWYKVTNRLLRKRYLSWL